MRYYKVFFYVQVCLTMHRQTTIASSAWISFYIRRIFLALKVSSTRMTNKPLVLRISSICMYTCLVNEYNIFYTCCGTGSFLFHYETMLKPNAKFHDETECKMFQVIFRNKIRIQEFT